MRDVLGWDCHEDCKCEELGHVHHNDSSLISSKPKKPKNWWQILF